MSEDLYVRACQECGHKQVMNNPAGMKGDGWKEAKCRKCKSEALDFGSYGWTRDVDQKLVKRPSDFLEEDD